MLGTTSEMALAESMDAGNEAMEEVAAIISDSGLLLNTGLGFGLGGGPEVILAVAIESLDGEESRTEGISMIVECISSLTGVDAFEMRETLAFASWSIQIGQPDVQSKMATIHAPVTDSEPINSSSSLSGT
jgi:hypothetical protein